MNEEWLQLSWLQARRRSLQALHKHEEVWESRTLGAELAAASRTAAGELLADPVWQLA